MGSDQLDNKTAVTDGVAWIAKNKYHVNFERKISVWSTRKKNIST